VISTRKVFAVLLLAVLIVAESIASEPVVVRRTVYLMGTVADLEIAAACRAEGMVALETFIRFLEDEEARLSTWKDSSRWSRLNQQAVGVPLQLDPLQCALFGRLRYWNRALDGAFDPAIAQLVRVWDLRGEGRLAGAEELGIALGKSGLGHFKFEESSCTVTRETDAEMDGGAFGKGAALDRLAAFAKERCLSRWMVNLGGQILVSRPPGEPFSAIIAHPQDRLRGLLEVSFRSGSMATSANSERGKSVGGSRIGHILDPRTARPATFDGSVTVWSDSALVADILSTGLFVMGPEQGLAWAESRGVSACFVTPNSAGVLEVAMTQTFKALHPKILEPLGGMECTK